MEGIIIGIYISINILCLAWMVADKVMRAMDDYPFCSGIDAIRDYVCDNVNNEFVAAIIFFFVGVLFTPAIMLDLIVTLIASFIVRP